MRTLVLVLVLAACGDDGGVTPDAAIVDDALPPDAAGPPTTLAETGLCDDPGCQTINAGVLAYRPRYPLYSDTAEKKRWLQLPAGTKIDTSDMNYWKFPTGTKVWKEFTRDGVRVETRFIMKVGDDDAAQASWYWAAFIWDAAQTTATIYDPQTITYDVNGTMHDVPSRGNCRRCHQNTPGRILGVQALSLDAPAEPGEVGLRELIAMDLLSAPPTAPASPSDPYFPLPGTDIDKAAFGFMHANCGGCHNTTSDIYDMVDLQMRMDVTKLATVEDQLAYATLVNQPAMLSAVPGTLVVPNNPGDSVVIRRMQSLTAGIKMPEIGTETLDDAGIAAITAWINALP